MSTEHDRDDVDVHLPVPENLELIPGSADLSEEENVSIADRRWQVPPRDGLGPPWSRIGQPDQEQDQLPSVSCSNHAMAPSGASYWYCLASCFTFMSVLTSVGNCSNSRRVSTEVNDSAASDAYCFGNAFVFMNSVSGFSTGAILRGPAEVFSGAYCFRNVFDFISVSGSFSAFAVLRRSAEVFENDVVSNNDDGSHDGSRDCCSNSRRVFTEVNDSTAGGTAYCFGNVFVVRNNISGSVPVLGVSSEVLTQSFETAVVANSDGHDDNSSHGDGDHDDVKIDVNITLPM